MARFTNSEKDFFCTAPFFRGIPPGVVYSLFDISDAVHFPKNAHISCIGDTVDPVFFVMSGLLGMGTGGPTLRIRYMVWLCFQFQESVDNRT